MTLSVIIICKNEQDMIEACLQSVQFADEIIVLDSGSADQTIEIAKRYTPYVFETDWPGFGPQKNRALEKATGDWVLSIDADERVPTPLKDEIRMAIKNSEHDAFDIRRTSYFLGHKIRFGDWKDKLHICLFKKGTARFSDDIVHECVIAKGRIKKLKYQIDHYPYRTRDDIKRKTDHYAKLGREKRIAKGKKGGWLIASLKASFAFLRTYVFKLGFLDGKAGFLIAKMGARYTYLRYY